MRSLKRLLPYFRAYRRHVAAGVVLVVISSGLASVIPWVLRGAIDGLRGATPVSAALRAAGLMLAAALIGGAMRYWMRELMNGVSRRIEYDLRNDLFARLASLDAAFYAKWRTGDLMARLTNDLGAVRMAAGPAIMYLVNTITGGVFALVFMLRISPRLTAIALLPMIALPALTVWLGRLVHDRFEAVQEHFSNLTTSAQENLAGTRVVRAYRQEDAEIARFRASSAEYLRLNMHLATLYGIMHPSFSLLAGLGSVIVLSLGGLLALRGTISVGSYVAFGLYLGMLTWPLIALGWVTNLFQRGAASMTRLLEVLDARAIVADPATPKSLPPAARGRRIEFRGVGFHYPAAEGDVPRWVLRDISFIADAGATIGIAGATGSGKSALVDLVARIHDPQEGEILVDGVPIRDVALAELRREIGYVPQESLLFSDTIGSNVTYGIEGFDFASDSDTSAVEVPVAARRAASIAQLDRTIAEFAGGFGTVLGERGVNLSGGQKQRAALARALAREPHIVILDDALSAVDTHTEAEILHALRDELSGRTALIASHRVSALRDATWTVVLDQGRIVEQGTHDTLLAARGRYWTLLHRQQQEEAIEDGDAVAAAGAR